MSLLSISPSPAAALPAVNFHPHNHRRASNLDPGNDASGSTAAQVPVAAAQNLFGTVLKALEAVVGLQLGTTPGAAANSTAPSGSSTAAAGDTAAAGSTAAKSTAPAPQSAGALLQNYLNNLSQQQQTDIAQAKFTGPSVSAKV